MDFLIVYERKNRELENSVLLKIELEKRGHSCDIVQFYDGSKFNVLNISPPKVMIVPHLYNTKSVSRNLSRFGEADHIVNLQYEQVLSNKWEKLGHHNPKGEAKKAVHICWGEKTADRLLNQQIAKERLPVLGAIQLDLLRNEFRKEKEDLKHEIGSLYDLPLDKKWTLFLSSFTYADITDERLKMNESVAKTKLDSFVGLHTKSRDEILVWIENILKQDKNNIIIYRPHPDELSLGKVVNLEKKHPNLRIINKLSAKVWIESSDYILSWYSTTVVESHFLGKPYSILRPFELPDDFDSVLLKHANFITNYDDFEHEYFKAESKRHFAINDSYIEQYYVFDEKRPSFLKLCDALEKIFYSQERQQFNITITDRLIAKIKSIFAFFVYCLYRISSINLNKYRNRSKNNFWINWFIEMENQSASDMEKKEIENVLLSRLK